MIHDSLVERGAIVYITCIYSHMTSNLIRNTLRNHSSKFLPPAANIVPYLNSPQQYLINKQPGEQQETRMTIDTNEYIDNGVPSTPGKYAGDLAGPHLCRNYMDHGSLLVTDCIRQQGSESSSCFHGVFPEYSMSHC